MVDLFEQAKQNIDNRLRIKKVTISNYRNIPYLEIDLNGESVVFQGQNEIGKTNIIESMFYAVSGKLFNGLAKAEKIGLKPIDSDNDTKTSIKIEFIKENFTIEKVFYEKWTKGNEFRGTEITYYVNGAVTKNNSQATELLSQYLGIDVLENKFKGKDLVDLDLYSLFYNTNYLRTVDYKLLRSLIIDMVGDVKAQDIINAKPEIYRPLVSPLMQHNNELQTLKTSTRTELIGDKNKKGVLDIISQEEAIKEDYEKQSNIELDFDEIEKAKETIKIIKEEINQLEVKKTSTTSSIINDYDLKISNKQLEYQREESKIKEAHNLKLQGARDVETEKELKEKRTLLDNYYKERSSLSEKITEKQNQITRLNSTIEFKQREIKEKTNEKEILVEQYKTIKNSTTSELLTCPHCDKPFHLHETKEHQEIIIKQLDSIKNKGITTKELIDVLQGGVNELQENVNLIQKDLDEIINQREELDDKVDVLQDNIKSLKETLESNAKNTPILDLNVEPLLNINKEIKDLQDAKNNALLNVEAERQLIQDKINEKKNELSSLEQITSKEKIRNNDLKRVEEKKQLLTELYERETTLKERLNLINKLEKDIYETLDNRVQTLFGENFSFQLYKQNLDGSYDVRMCEIFGKNRQGKMVNMQTINTGTYHKRAIEFITIIKKHYKIESSFVFVDELSSLDQNNRHELLAFGEQVLATMVSEDKTLKKEVLN